MCVRTLIVNETNQTNAVHSTIVEEKKIQQLSHQEKLTKAKEKYMKIHDEIVERDLEMMEQRRIENDIFISEISDDILAKSTAKYGVLITLIAKWYAIFQQSNIHKWVLVEFYSIKREIFVTATRLTIIYK